MKLSFTSSSVKKVGRPGRDRQTGVSNQHHVELVATLTQLGQDGESDRAHPATDAPLFSSEISSSDWYDQLMVHTNFAKFIFDHRCACHDFRKNPIQQSRFAGAEKSC